MSAQNATPAGVPGANELFAQQRWPELVNLLAAVDDRSAEQEYEYGMALAQMQRWVEARAAFLRGSRLEPRDKRFPIELAGVAFKEKQTRAAIRWLRRGLQLDPHDDYANDFLATLYFLQGNLEAAIKYWNRVSSPKPLIAAVNTDPSLRIRPALLDHAIAFSPASTLTLQQLRETEARLPNIELFPAWRIDLVARADGRFDSVLHAREFDGFGSTTLEALLRVFSGLPFLEVTPEYYNLNGTATNITGLERWDPDKRRNALRFSAPLGRDPRWRLSASVDLRNENWDVRNGFTGPAPVLASLNLRREEVSLEIARIVGWRLRWLLGAELSHRDFRNTSPGSVLTPELLAQGFQLKQKAAIDYQILRLPEHRLFVLTAGSAEAARLWSQPEESFLKLQASLEARWLPLSRGDDLETRWRARAGHTFGQLPFDELLMLGLERDNDPGLWLRAHIGTRGGRKGSAPLGRQYFVSSWQTDKFVYRNGLISVQIGPFVDSGKITDPDPGLGSHRWLWDTGAETTLRVLGMGAAFIYGKDLRTGNNAFYVTLRR